MPPASADLATTWAFLEDGVDHIMTKLQTGVSYSKYMSLYTVAYNYCTSSRMHSGTHDGSMAGRSTSSLIRGDRVKDAPVLTRRSAGANLMGSDLYNNLIRYFVAHLKELKDVSDYAVFGVRAVLIVAYRPRIPCRTRSYYVTTLPSGTGLRPARITLTAYSPT